jgi:N-hydroxyarylamine O-acetyltransferase
MDLPAYLARIGVSGDLRPDEATLRRLVWGHVSSIAFENVDVQLGRPIRIDLESIERKLVGSRRGGYCFEQNALFAAVLGELGYSVTTLAARVRWNRVGPTPRTHMLSVVRLDGASWVADVGFGGFVPTEPLRLVEGREQETSLGTFRFLRESGFLVLQARIERGFSDMYAFTEEPHGPVDYEVMNHYTSTHPASRFKTSLIVSRPTRDARHSLLDREYVIRRGGEATKRLVAPGEIPALLREVFELDVPDGTTFPAIAG